MKKSVYLICISLIFILSSSLLLIGQTNNDSDDGGNVEIDNAPETDANTISNKKGYEWLTNEVDGKCDELTLNEQIAVLLALGYKSDINSECKNALAPTADIECWPIGNCNLKTTSQAILALSKAGYNTEKAVEWLISQNTTSTDLTWYLEIDSNSATSCSITYGSGGGYNINIGEDKKISGSAGGCLSLESHGYWFRISSSCYNNGFTIECDQPFLTTLLYSELGSDTIYVSEKVSSASASAATSEKIETLCFKQGSSCDYEGSLWATSVLDYKGKKISSFVPYLNALIKENSRYLPESFLYSLTDQEDFRISLVDKQKNNHWDESGDRFYDTAIAMLSLSSDVSTEKDNTIAWLLETQDAAGGWKSNVLNTAWILYSTWPIRTIEPDNPQLDCELSNYYCSSRTSCSLSGGNEKSGYLCPGVDICCDVLKPVSTCEEKQGIICNSDETCSLSGRSVSASDILSDQICCVGGTCKPKTEPIANECEDANGVCSVSCDTDEEERDLNCEVSSDVCCFAKEDPEPTNYTWIIILGVLILLIILGILFREKIRMLLFRTKSKFKGSPHSGPHSGFPGFPSSPSQMQRPMPTRPMSRTILPPGSSSSQQRFQRRSVSHSPQKSSEMDEVLKKLREMGK